MNMSKDSASVKIFRVKGRFKGKNEEFKFVREIRALSEEEAKEIVYSTIGSNHKVKRHHIKFDEITVISPNKASDPTIRYLSNLET
jgi:large subunit ribosomal protein LX